MYVTPPAFPRTAEQEAAAAGWHARHQTLMWLRAAIRQGRNCLSLSQEMLDSARVVDDQRKGALQAREHYRRFMELHEQQFVAEHFFLNASGKALDWLLRLKQFQPGVKAVYAALSKQLEKVAELRNMREHDDEYMRGKGRHRDKLFFAGNGAVADGTSTVIMGGQYLLGNRLDVRATVDAVSSALDQIEALPDERRPAGRGRPHRAGSPSITQNDVIEKTDRGDQPDPPPSRGSHHS